VPGRALPTGGRAESPLLPLRRLRRRSAAAGVGRARGRPGTYI